MGAVLLRLGLLALGMGLVEIGLSDAIGQGSPGGWLVVLVGGLPLVVAGTAGFVGPLVGAGRGSGRGDGHND